MVTVFVSPSLSVAVEAGNKIEDVSMVCSLRPPGVQPSRLRNRPNHGNESWLRALVNNTSVGAFLLQKLDRFRQRHCDSKRRQVTEKELRRLNQKIEKLLTTLDDAEIPSDIASAAVAEEEECVICLSARATIQTFPCAHRVACRRCFVRTIQTAIAERSLPLRCVVCRTRILKLSDPVDPSTLTTTATATTLTNNFGRVTPKELIGNNVSPSPISSLPLIKKPFFAHQHSFNLEPKNHSRLRHSSKANLTTLKAIGKPLRGASCDTVPMALGRSKIDSFSIIKK